MDDAARQRGARQTWPAPVGDALLRGVADHQRDDQVTPNHVRQAGDGNVAHTGAGGETGFDFQRVHVAAAADQHVVGAAGYGQPSFCIDFPEVAGGQPAIGIDAAAVEVTGHHLGAADADAAIGSQREFVVTERPAHQSLMPSAVADPVGGDLRAGFAHAVARGERPAGSGRAVVKALAQRRAADHHVAQACGRASARVEQAGQHRRYQRQVGNRIPAQRFAHGLGREAIVQQDTGPGAGAAPEDRKAADMVKGQAVQPQVAGLQVEVPVRCGGSGVETGIAEHDVARYAFAAAGRNDDGDIGRQAVTRPRCFLTVAVDRQKGPIFQAASKSVAGQVEAAAGNTQQLL